MEPFKIFGKNGMSAFFWMVAVLWYVAYLRYFVAPLAFWPGNTISGTVLAGVFFAGIGAVLIPHLTHLYECLVHYVWDTRKDLAHREAFYCRMVLLVLLTVMYPFAYCWVARGGSLSGGWLTWLFVHCGLVVAALAICALFGVGLGGLFRLFVDGFWAKAEVKQAH